MKKSSTLFFVAAGFLLAVVIPSRAQNDQTIKNLKTAFAFEVSTSAKYDAFAVQAKKEGFPQIAMLLTVLSKAEEIHARNHKTVLERMGSKPESPVQPEIQVKSTLENLQAVLKSDNDEAAKLYPGFINTAKSERATDAVKSLRWAMETEKRHVAMVQNAIYALTGNKISSLPKVYFVCPKCGNTYDTPKTESLCSFCSTASSKFIRVDK